MPTSFTLPTTANCLGLMAPAADAAGRTSRYVTTKFCAAGKAYILCYINQGNAATVTLTPKQATDVSGTSAKVLTGGCRIWACLDTATSDQLIRQADAVNYTTDAGVKEKLVVFEVDVADLDQANAFITVAVATGASNAANITSAVGIFGPVRYECEPLPSIIVN